MIRGQAAQDPLRAPLGEREPPKHGLLTRVAAGAAKVRSDLTLALLDALLVASAFAVAIAVPFEGMPGEQRSLLWVLIPLGVVVHLTANGVSGLYGRVWQQAGVQEARRVLIAGGSACLALLVMLLPVSTAMPITVVIPGSAMALVLCGGLRFQSRLFAFRRREGDASDDTRLVVIGAGNAAGHMVREMLATPLLGLCPVALLDDSRRLHGRQLAGVPIIGGLDAMEQAKEEYGAEQALLAIPSADSAYVARAFEVARAAGLTLRVLPSVAELVGGSVSLRDVRDVSIGDLLGRKQITTDLGAVGGIIAGRRVLITGAGGSIGSEIARQVAAFGPSALLLLDHDETHLHDVAADIPQDVEQVLADIRDLEHMRGLLEERRPEVIFHAAAHKHVPLLERHPCEAVTTNVIATDNLLRVAADIGVRRFVFISTDKAVRPSSVMGATKHLGEQLLLHHRPGGASYCAVRFGNVLGSRGSVIPTFVKQIQRGGPVTVTDPDAMRFFMSIPEAVQLVLQAAALSHGGEVFMLDMGQPLRIVDLAARMIHLSGRNVGEDVQIAFTGLRPGEKLVEELRGAEESAMPTAHPSIMSVQPVMTDGTRLTEGLRTLHKCVEQRDQAAAAEALFDLVRSGSHDARLAG